VTHAPSVELPDQALGSLDHRSICLARAMPA
jgi:hypothetical protein